MEAGPGDVRPFKELLRLVQCRLDVPGDKVHIAAVEAGSSASEGERLRAVPSGEGFLQPVPEVEDLFTAFLLPQGIQGVAEEARHHAVGVEIVHKIVIRVQIAVDKRGAAGGANHHIQAPVGVRVLMGLHLVAHIGFQKGFWVGGEFQPFFPQLFGELGHENGRFLFGFLQHIEAVYVPHVGDLTQHLIGEGSEHPPGPAFFLPKHRQQLFTVGGDSKTVFALPLQPNLHILSGDFPAVIGAQADVLDGLTAHQDVPVLQHFFSRVLLEID